MDDKELNKLLENALLTNYEPGHELNEKLMQNIRGNKMTTVKKTRKFSILAAACCLILGCSVTVFAALNFLTPKEVATEYGDKQLAQAFESKDAIVMNESQTDDNYMVTLLGTVSGKGLSQFCTGNEQVEQEKTYAVVAIRHKDGTPMPSTLDNDYGQESFFVSPLIQGLNPKDYNIITMNGGYSEMVKDGVMYRMIECDSIELFADKHLYLGVSNTVFYDVNAYQFDKKSGAISKNKNYKGLNLLFDLPLDKNKANKEEADKYLKQLELQDSASKDDSADAKSDKTIPLDEILNKWDKTSEEKIVPDKEGRINYSYHTSRGGSGDGYILEEELFSKGQTGYADNYQIFEESGQDNHITQTVLLFNRDKTGTITLSIYEN